jgi:hypothetical protein
MLRYIYILDISALLQIHSGPYRFWVTDAGTLIHNWYVAVAKLAYSIGEIMKISSPVQGICSGLYMDPTKPILVINAETGFIDFKE